MCFSVYRYFEKILNTNNGYFHIEIIILIILYIENKHYSNALAMSYIAPRAVLKTVTIDAFRRIKKRFEEVYILISAVNN